MDKAQTNPKEGASFITLCPYTPPKIKKKQKYRNVVNFDHLFGPQSWTKYFEIESVVNDDFKLYTIH